MIGAVVENIIGGYLHPRASVRRMLAAGHGLDGIALMVTLAFLLRMIFLIVVPGAGPERTGIQIGWYLAELATFLIIFALLSLVVYSVGRFFGGKGTARETGIALAWYLLVTSVIDLLFLTAMVPVVDAGEAMAASPAHPIDVPGWALVVFVASIGIATWLFASFVAELHRFARTWNVLMAIVGLAMAFGLLASAVMQLA